MGDDSGKYQEVAGWAYRVAVENVENGEKDEFTAIATDLCEVEGMMESYYNSSLPESPWIIVRVERLGGARLMTQDVINRTTTESNRLDMVRPHRGGDGT